MSFFFSEHKNSSKNTLMNAPIKYSYLKIHAAVFLFGVAGLFGKWINLPAEVIVFGRVFFGGLVFAIFFYFSKEKIKITSRRDLATIIFSGLLLAFHWVAFFRSIQISTVAIGLLSYSVFPFFTVLLEPVFLKTKLRLSFIFPALLIIAGVYLILPSFSLDNSTTTGVIWGLLSGLSFAFITIINRMMIRHYSSRMLSFYLNLFACVVLIPFLFSADYNIVYSDIVLLLLLGVVFTAVAHNLFIGGMRHIPARVAGLIAALEPVYAIIFALILLKEVPDTRTIAGGLLIIISMIGGSRLR